MIRDQLVLADETLRVLLALLPFGRACVEVTRARNVDDCGHLATAEVRALAWAFSRAAGDRTVVTDEALREAAAEFAAALRRLDLNALELDGRHTVGILVRDRDRDGPRESDACDSTHA